MGLGAVEQRRVHFVKPGDREPPPAAHALVGRDTGRAQIVLDPMARYAVRDAGVVFGAAAHPAGADVLDHDLVTVWREQDAATAARE
ncbi:hypothetical protein [Mesorhizobium sp. M1406]|uniref:hypothetical protein n=1 Tax=Mesorhizobium sp. M1406 TaxID=2957099 RepID=UPI0033361968